MDTMTNDLKKTRRRHSRELKAQMLAECEAPGASVAKVAMSHGINANIVHGWRKQAREGGAMQSARSLEFVPVSLAPTAQLPCAERKVEIELRRGTVCLKISWPTSATTDLATWTRELLR
jgi:transposase